jgi:hypothetical protein
VHICGRQLVLHGPARRRAGPPDAERLALRGDGHGRPFQPGLRVVFAD